MDPQKLSQLDPKLREAYQRVMGTKIPEPQVTPVQTQAPPQAGGGLTAQPAVSIPEPTAPAPAQPTSNFVRMNSEVTAVPAAPAPALTPNFTAPAPQAQAMTMEKKNNMMIPILFGIVGLIFIVIYTFFWTKFFNLKLPFLP